MFFKFNLLIVFVFVVTGAYAQTYYYYGNEKIDIHLDKDFLSVNSLKNTNFLEKYGSNYLSKTEFSENHSRSYVQKKELNQNEFELAKNYYSEIELVENVKSNPINYQEFVQLLSNDDLVYKVSPCFKTPEGKRLGLTNNFYVKIDLNSYGSLVSYAQENFVEILGKDPYMDNWYILSCTKQNVKNSVELANQFYESGLFITAEPEFVFHDLQTSNDPLYSSQWGLLNSGLYGSGYSGIDINAEQAWTITKGDNIKVAIYDHGFEMNHPDLAANVYGTGYDATTGSSPSQVRGSHGTPCAGIIGAVQNNNLGVSGVAPESDIVSISIDLLFSDTPAQLASGFNWAWQNNVAVISNSWGGYTPSSIITDAIYNAINLGRNGLGCVVVFASGNENNTNIRYPGSAVPEVLVVGAMSPCGERKNPSSCDGEYWGACYGSQLDIVAPGVKIPTTDRQSSAGYSSGNYYNEFNGTSSACPHIAGVAALVLSVNPCLSALQVRNIIEQTAQKVGSYSYSTAIGRPNGSWNSEMGYGLVDAHAAVLLAQAMGSTDRLFIKDDQSDTGIEPNPNILNVSSSNDIWVRKNDDGGTTHENPEYLPNGNYQYVKVKVTNKGCLPSSGLEQLKLYWAKGTANLSYPNPWNGGVTHQVTGANMGDLIATLTIPVIQPGSSAVLTFPWQVPDPLTFSNDSPPSFFSLLARIVAGSEPMFSAETSNLEQNVRANNNIAWKNISVVGLSY